MEIEDKRNVEVPLGSLCAGDVCSIRDFLCIVADNVKPDSGIEVFNLNMNTLQTYESKEPAQYVRAKIVLED